MTFDSFKRPWGQTYTSLFSQHNTVLSFCLSFLRCGSIREYKYGPTCYMTLFNNLNSACEHSEVPQVRVLGSEEHALVCGLVPGQVESQESERS